MVDNRPAADRILVAQITGEARHRARWRDLSTGEEAAAVAGLRELASGRADLLAEVAGIFEGTSEGKMDEPLARQAAALCRKAGADELAIAAWAEEGRRRAASARQSPFPGGLHLGARDFRTACPACRGVPRLDISADRGVITLIRQVRRQLAEHLVSPDRRHRRNLEVLAQLSGGLYPWFCVTADGLGGHSRLVGRRGCGRACSRSLMLLRIFVWAIRVPAMPSDISITTQVAADILGMSIPSVRDLFDAGLVSGAQPRGNRRQYLYADVLAVAARGEADVTVLKKAEVAVLRVAPAEAADPAEAQAVPPTLIRGQVGFHTALPPGVLLPALNRWWRGDPARIEAGDYLPVTVSSFCVAVMTDLTDAIALGAGTTRRWYFPNARLLAHVLDLAQPTVSQGPQLSAKEKAVLDALLGRRLEANSGGPIAYLAT